MASQPFVTQSEIKTYRACRRKWTLQYQENLVPKTAEPGALFFGNVVHDGLRLHYTGRTQEEINAAIDKTFADAMPNMPNYEEAEAAADRQLAKNMIRGYKEAFAVEDRAYASIQPEVEFMVPLGPGLPMFAGKVDGIARDQDGDYWLKEHKTAAAVGEDYFRMLQVDMQYPAYLWAAEIHLGINIKGVIYNVLRKAEPKEPDLLKGNKGLSRAESKMGTWTERSYLNAIHANGLDPAEYTDMLALLREQDAAGNRWFYRRFIFNDRNRNTMVMNEVRETAKEMTNNPVIFGNPNTMTCRGCPFFSLCAVWHERGTLKDTIDLMYERKEEAHQELSSPAWLF